MTIRRLDSNGRRSRAVIHAGLVHFAGQVADDFGGDITSQTQEALARIDRLLGEAGSDRSRVISATIWLKTMADYAGMNAVWDGWIDRDNAPARCCGVVEMADPGILVEIIMVAAT
jgi:enamine deaminase RidA (YjgF/YER057c/UK114 family)